MKTFLPGALAAAVCVAFMALPSGEARAQTPTSQTEQCGALASGGGAATCADRAYTAYGIRYMEGTRWTEGIAGDVSLTVTGGPNTLIRGDTPIFANWASDIVVRTAVQPGMGATTATRAIALTVGPGANPVRLELPPPETQNSNGIGDFSATGVVVQQRGRAADATTVTIGSGVTMGTPESPRWHRGVHVLVEMGTNTADHSIASAATIHSHGWGILMDARGSGNVSVTNSGSITTTLAPRIGGRDHSREKSGIRILDRSGPPFAARTADTRTTVTNSGAITVVAPNAHGIHVNASGLGLYRVVHTGTGENRIMASGEGGHGVYVDSGTHGLGAAGTDGVQIESSGDITASGVNARGVHVASWQSGTEDKSNIRVTTTGGTIRAGGDTGEGDAGIWVQSVNPNPIIVANRANISASTYGVIAINNTRTCNGPTCHAPVTVTHSAGAITSRRGIGILAVIGGNNTVANSEAVTVNVAGGSVTASPTRNSVAVQARTSGTGSVNVNVSQGATLTSMNNVGVFAVMEANRDNRTGKITIEQGGAITGKGGVYALVTGHSSGASRSADAQPVVDVTWTGSFTRASRTNATGGPRLEANSLAHAFAIDHEARVAELFPRVAEGPIILAEVMSWRTASYFVAAADKPAIADGDAADAILDSATSDTANYGVRTKVLAAVEDALNNSGYTVPGVDTGAYDTDGTPGLSAAEVVAWLKAQDDRATIMTQALQYAFTRQEEEVLKAMVGQGDMDLTTALDNLETAVGTLPDGYRDMATMIAGRHNDGNIRIRVNSSITAATGDAVRAMFAFPNDANGGISVIVAEGATVTGGEAGIYAANAGLPAPGALDAALNQHVQVDGTVVGGTDAAVHLSKGGSVTVGPRGEVRAGSSGRAILVNDPGRAEIVVEGRVIGGAGGPAAVHLTGGGTVIVHPTGTIDANGAEHAIRGDAATTVVVHTATLIRDLTPAAARKAVEERVLGTIGAGPGDAPVVVRYAELEDGELTGHSRTVPVGDDGKVVTDMLHEAPPPEEPPPAPPPGRAAPPPFDCGTAMDGRCGLYEALPSVLTALNGLPGYDERLSAARGNGGWALVEGGSGEWKAASATQGNVAYDLRRHGVRAGVELAAGERLRVGVSAHRVGGTAKMGDVGEIELTGAGAGASATLTGDGFYADAQAAVTWFDAELTSATHGMLNGVQGGEAKGVGYALGVEAGRRIDVSDGLAVTPRAAFEWSDASSISDFTDSVGSGALVSVDEARSLTGRAGVRLEAMPGGADGVRLFGALDVSHLLSQGAEARVEGSALKTTSEETGLRAGVGASRAWDNVSLQGAAHYEASGGGNSGFGAALSLAMRF